MGIMDGLRALRTMTMPASPLSDAGTIEPLSIDTVEIDEFTFHGINREGALTIPALLRARNLICTTCARLPIVAVRDGIDIPDQPAWLSRTDGLLSPYHRMIWTIDDLLFYGWSLWKVTRDYSGHVLTADRVPWAAWSFDAENRILVDDLPVSAATHILIPGIHEGILELGKTTIPEALAFARGVRRAVETPAHTTELHQTNDKPLDKEKVQELKNAWIKARKGRDGGVAFTTAGIEIKEHGSIKEHLLVEGRNAVAVDLARLCSIPASMIDATLSGTSLSYSNTSARMAELITFGIAPMISAVAARLGMDDIVPRGVSLRVNVSEATADIAVLTVPDDNAPSLPPTPESEQP